MEQVLYGGAVLGQTLEPADTIYAGPIAGPMYPEETWVYKLMSPAGVIKYLRFKLSGAPGVGKKYTFTLILNGAPTAMTFEIADNDTTGNDIVHQIDVVGGDKVSIRIVPTGNPAAVVPAWTSIFSGETDNESLITGGSWWPMHFTAAIEYAQVMCGFTQYDDIEIDHRQVVPTAGTIKNLYVETGVDPGDPPEGFRWTLRKGLPMANTGLTVTIIADDNTGNDLVHTVDVVASDILTLMIEIIDVPGFPRSAWAMTFVADVDGESIVMGGSLDDLNAAATEYLNITSSEIIEWNPVEADERAIGHVSNLKKLYLLLSGSPGVGNSYDFTVRIAGAGSNITVHIHDNDTTGNSGALEDDLALDEYVGLQVVPLGGPTVRDAYWGFVCYIELPRVTMLGIKHADVGVECTDPEWEGTGTHILAEGGAFPGVPTEKGLFYRTDLHKWFMFNGTDWIDLGG